MDKEEDMQLNLNMKDSMKDRVIGILNKNSYKITEQRLIIIEYILKTKKSTSKEVYLEIIKDYPKIGISTVYRTVRILKDLGIISLRRSDYKFRILN